MTEIVNNIFSVTAPGFEALALDIFNYQYQHCAVYNQWVNALGIKVLSVKKIEQIPFLPISFFKQFDITTGRFRPQVIFTSSGTTATINSRHLVKDAGVYEESFTQGFTRFYGPVADYCIVGLLPGYLERSGSSLVYMVDQLIKDSKHPLSGFYLDDVDGLQQVLVQLEAQQQKTLLIGVTFALLDFAATHPMPLQHTIVMETGGMKGRKKEMVRQEVHDYLCRQFGLQQVHSEYGMTELLSQAYSVGHGIFTTVPWMKVLLRDETDPLTVYNTGRGVMNLIDLANINSCCFIATDDIGIVHPGGNFEVLGRMDESDIRGCSLLTV